jgi:hypothetical protein
MRGDHKGIGPTFSEMGMVLHLPCVVKTKLSNEIQLGLNFRIHRIQKLLHQVPGPWAVEGLVTV